MLQASSLSFLGLKTSLQVQLQGTMTTGHGAARSLRSPLCPTKGGVGTPRGNTTHPTGVLVHFFSLVSGLQTSGFTTGMWEHPLCPQGQPEAQPGIKSSARQIFVSSLEGLSRSFLSCAPGGGTDSVCGEQDLRIPE